MFKREALRNWLAGEPRLVAGAWGPPTPSLPQSPSLETRALPRRLQPRPRGSWCPSLPGCFRSAPGPAPISLARWRQASLKAAVVSWNSVIVYSLVRSGLDGNSVLSVTD